MKDFTRLTKGGGLIVNGPGCHCENCPREGTHGVIEFFRDGSYRVIISHCQTHGEPSISKLWERIKTKPELQNWRANQ